IDRKALPAPDQSATAHERVLVAPRTPLEGMLATMWTQLLGRERIGVYDNFFELGGHSLLATKLVTRLRTAFQVDLPLRALFEAPTVASLAEQVERARQAEPHPPAPPMLPIARTGVLPLS